MRYNRIYESNNFIVNTDYTHTICDYAEAFELTNVPADVIEKAKQILIHTIGAVYAAKDMPEAQKIRKAALQANGGEGGAVTNWATGEKLSALNASMATGALADMLEWSDCTGTGHPAAAAAPVAWLTAEETHKGGKDVLRAIILSYDISQRVAKAVFPGEHGKLRGFGMTSWQMFSAFIAAGSVYGFDSRGYDLGIGTVCENSTIPALYYKTTMSECGHYEFGFRNKDGLHCAKAVVKGLNNGRDAFDEDKCYNSAISDAPKHEYFKKDLGVEYEVCNSILRRWPADMWAQTAATVTDRICREHELRPCDIDEVIVNAGVSGMMDVPDESYESIVHAQNNIPFILASVIMGVEPGAAWYTHERMSDPEVLALARKVKAGDGIQPEQVDCYEKLAFQKSLPEICVTIRAGGIEYKKTCACAGAISTNEELSALFISQVSPTLGIENAQKALDTLLHIEDCNDISELSWIVGSTGN